MQTAKLIQSQFGGKIVTGGVRILNIDNDGAENIKAEIEALREWAADAEIPSEDDENYEIALESYKEGIKVLNLINAGLTIQNIEDEYGYPQCLIVC